MKKSYGKFINILIFILIVIITFTTVIPVFHYYAEKPFFRNAYSLSPDPDSMFRNQLLDSLPYKNINHQLDSIRSVTDLYERTSNSLTILALLGFGRNEECDTCEYRGNMVNWYNSPKPDTRYYFILPDLAPVENEITSVHKPVFFKKKGKFYKKFLRLDSSVENGYKDYRFTWSTIQQSYGVSELTSSPEITNRSLLFPVSKTMYYILQALSFITGFVILVLFLSIVRYTILFIFQLSKGRAFSVKNYTHLFFIGYGLLLIPLFSLLVKYIVHLFLKKHYSTDFIFYFDWKGSAQTLLLALVSLLLARAIKKGYEIQEEQDLTI